MCPNFGIVYPYLVVKCPQTLGTVCPYLVVKCPQILGTVYPYLVVKCPQTLGTVYPYCCGSVPKLLGYNVLKNWGIQGKIYNVYNILSIFHAVVFPKVCVLQNKYRLDR